MKYEENLVTAYLNFLAQNIFGLAILIRTATFDNFKKILSIINLKNIINIDEKTLLYHVANLFFVLVCFFPVYLIVNYLYQEVYQ